MKKILSTVFLIILFTISVGYAGGINTGSIRGSVSDEPYSATSWDGISGMAPSKNAVRDLIVGGLATNYAQTVIVAKSGGQYTTIQGAIDSITDATTSKRYAVIVYPGVYTENIVMEDYVDIVGFGRTNSIISATSGTAVTFPANKGTVMDMGITAAYGTLGANSTAISSAGADSAMVRCDLIVSKSGGDFTMRSVSVTAGSFRMTDCYHSYAITGTTTATSLTQSAFYQTGALTLFLVNNNELIMTCDDTNDDVVGFETNSGSVGSFILKNNILTVSAADTACALWLQGTATGATVTDNRFTVSGTANTSWGLYIDSTAGGATVKTLNNEINITSSGNAYSCEVLTGDIWNSFFDEITAAEGTTGAGTKNMVSSLGLGNLTGTIFSTKPQSLTVTTEADIILTSTLLLLTGDDDTDNDTIDLQDGTYVGQRLTIVGVALIDANDTITVAMTDTTCTGCLTVLLDEIGDTWELVWTGSTWATVGNSEVP